MWLKGLAIFLLVEVFFSLIYFFLVFHDDAITQRSLQSVLISLPIALLASGAFLIMYKVCYLDEDF